MTFQSHFSSVIKLTDTHYSRVRHYISKGLTPIKEYNIIIRNLLSQGIHYTVDFMCIFMQV